jgi:transposase
MECFIIKDGTEHKAELEDILPLIEKDPGFQKILTMAFHSDKLFYDIPHKLALMPDKIKETFYRNVSPRISNQWKKKVSTIVSESKKEGFFPSLSDTSDVHLLFNCRTMDFFREHWELLCNPPKSLTWKEDKDESLIKCIEKACTSGELSIGVYHSDKISAEDVQKVFSAFQNRRDELARIHNLSITGNLLPVIIPFLEAKNIKKLRISGDLAELPEWIRSLNSLCSLSVDNTNITTQKFEMHLPYYRQEKQFEQIGAIISRQDMSNWQQQVYKKLRPLFVLLKETVKSGSVLQMDETTVQVLGEEGRDDNQKSRMWLARGGPPGKTVIWYEYHRTRAAYHAKEFLEGYRGYLQTDGYNGYDSAVKDMPGIIQVGCFAHARRKFFEAAKINKKPQSAEEGLKYIRRLYDIEDALRKEKEGQKKTDEQFLVERRTKATVILTEFRTWLEKRNMELPPSTLMGEAVGYMLSS